VLCTACVCVYGGGGVVVVLVDATSEGPWTPGISARVRRLRVSHESLLKMMANRMRRARLTTRLPLCEAIYNGHKEVRWKICRMGLPPPPSILHFLTDAVHITPWMPHQSLLALWWKLRGTPATPFLITRFSVSSHLQ
jgi:hypothetical protein